MLKNRNVFVLFLAMLLLNVLLTATCLGSHLTSRPTFNLSISQAGMILAINAVFQTIATIFAGQLLSKLFLHKEKRVILIATLMVAALLVGFVLSSNLYISVVLLLLISMISVTAFTAILLGHIKLWMPISLALQLALLTLGAHLAAFSAYGHWFSGSGRWWFVRSGISVHGRDELTVRYDCYCC